MTWWYWLSIGLVLMASAAFYGIGQFMGQLPSSLLADLDKALSVSLGETGKNILYRTTGDFLLGTGDFLLNVYGDKFQSLINGNRISVFP